VVASRLIRDPHDASAVNRDTEARGFAWGLLGVAVFGLTLPFTRLAVAGLDPLFVALGRAVLAALPAGLALAAMRTPFPPAGLRSRLVLAAVGVVVGFPVAATFAMTTAPASHGAVVLGLLPLATALAGTLRGGERPSPAFWAWAAAGSAVVVAFALRAGGGGLSQADAWLALAVVFAAFGYAEGAVVARSIGGWQTISWILVLSAPALLPVVVWLAATTGIARADASAWIGFVYVGLGSMFLGFLAWYRGLALGGTARVGQTQLLQGFFTLAGGWAVAGEGVEPESLLFLAAVVAIVALGRRAAVQRR
jgi:drug/metabolite transporter (DMT)-like permease